MFPIGAFGIWIPCLTFVYSSSTFESFVISLPSSSVTAGVAETRIHISIAVCVGEIRVTKLLTLDTTYGFLASDNIVRLVRVFVALSLCRNNLTRYDEVEKGKVPKFSCLFPNLTPCPAPVVPLDVLPNLAYKQFLS